MAVELKGKELNKNLIGKLLGRHSSFLDMSWILRTWRPRKGVGVRALENNFYLFSFDLAEDFMKAWSMGTVFFGKQCLAIRRWSPEIELVDRNMCYAQVWIRLPGFLEVSHSPAAGMIISAIASEFGQIIAVDSSDGEVHACVELDVNEPVVAEVGGVGGGVCQSLQYETRMLCFSCGRMDHRQEECDRNGGGGDDDGEYDRCGPNNMAPMKHSREPPFASLRYVSWRRPSPGWVKLNFDGAMKGGRQKGGAGGLLRDADGEFMEAFATPLATTKPLLAEIYALRDGLQMAVDSGAVEYIWIEGDSKIAIEMLNGWRELAEADQEEKQLMVECRNLIKRFRGVTARHIFREANQCADHLANLGVEARVLQQWRSSRSPPPSLLPFIWRDIAGYLLPRLVL